ncbi:hypothetical protein [Pyrococcus yayanosii]|uniref:Uncharacterized protein n=1 Tax=Pyrococcus yayanosii (strain CH1 / JCM 16557) TaxID=529709 RepID=F8AGT0_PYRYC|nr:hypothetical protein [Pyrococcus yayanosii]AEH25216.1 hypothetical protein PYCH_15500 [Pyrococcus yayanosii CH1]
MDIITMLVVVVAVIAGAIISAWIASNAMGRYVRELETFMATKAPEPQPIKRREEPKGSTKGEINQKKELGGINEEEIIKKLRQVIDEKVQNVLDEAKRKKERLLMLLDVARGYALGFITEEEYNAFLMKILGELDEFKRLWLARFPSQSDKEKLNQAIAYVARTKLPIELRSKDKEPIRLSPDEALIRMTSSINSALSILDELIKSRGENPAVTPLEIKLSQEVEKLRKKVENLEKRIQELEAL